MDRSTLREMQAERYCVVAQSLAQLPSLRIQRTAAAGE